MAARSVSKPEDRFTIGREVFESLSSDIGLVRAQADVLALLAATGDIDALQKDTLTACLLNMQNQLEDIYTRLNDSVAPEAEVIP